MSAASDKRDPRSHLVEAGLRLLASSPDLGALTPAAVTRESGLDAAGFAAHYANPLDYLQALLHALLDEARGEASRETDGLPRDLARLQRGIEAYLDSYLRRPALRGLMLALHTHPPAIQLNRSRINGWALFLQIELEALGVADAQPRAQLLVCMGAEVALAEFEAGTALPELRTTLFDYLRRRVA